MSEVEKRFVVPGSTTPLTKEVVTLMNPLALAIAIETGQLSVVGTETQSSIATIGFEGYLFKRTMTNFLKDLKEGNVHFS